MKKTVNILFLVVLVVSIYSCSSEQKKFRIASQANSIEALKAFARNYPNGEYIDRVKDLIDNLLWDSIVRKDVICDFENFIEDHPNSKYIDSAKQMIDMRMPAEEYENDVNDVDCNVYKVVKIGNQNWMAENLRTTRFKDRTPIAHVSDVNSWIAADSAAYSWYDNQVENKYQRGALYNGYAINDKLCPKGWHVPGQSEWAELIKHLGGEQIAGLKMKLSGDEFWVEGNEKSSNSSEFSALASGMRDANGLFSGIGETARWWTSGENEEATAAGLSAKSGIVVLGSHKKTNGFAVRCVEDVEEDE